MRYTEPMHTFQITSPDSIISPYCLELCFQEMKGKLAAAKKVKRELRAHTANLPKAVCLLLCVRVQGIRLLFVTCALT